MRFGCFRLFIIPATTLTRAYRYNHAPPGEAAISWRAARRARHLVLLLRSLLLLILLLRRRCRLPLSGLGRLAGASPGFFRGFASAAAAEGSKEDQIAKKLREVVAATHVEVEDISGGCGSMYRVMVVSPEFEGLALVKQHRARAKGHRQRRSQICTA